MTKTNQILIVASLGILIVCSLGLGLYKTQRMTEAVSHQAETSVEISLEIAQAHIALHGALLSQDLEGLSQAWAHLESADRYTTAILEGGRLKGHPVTRSKNQKSIESAQIVRSELKKLKRLVDILTNGGQDAVDGPTNETFNDHFIAVTSSARNLKLALSRSVEQDISQLRILQIILLTVCLVSLVLAIWYIRRYDNLRLTHSFDLQNARQHLEHEATGRATAEQNLVEKERLLLATLESTADGILVVDSKGVTQLANQKFAEVWGIPDTLLAERDDDKMQAFVLDQLEDPDQFISKVKALYQSSQEDTDTLHFKNGRVVRRFSKPLMDENKVTGRVWSFRDITQQTEAELALKKNEENYRATLRSMKLAVIIHAADSRIIFANPEACRLLNKSERQLRGLSFSDSIWPLVGPNKSTLSIERYPVNRVIISSEPTEQEVIGIKSKESDVTTWVLTSAFPLAGKGDNLKRVVVTMVDITTIYDPSPPTPQTKRLTTDQSPQQKTKLPRGVSTLQAHCLHASAKLAGQVAHDYNNLLGPLVAYPAMIRAELPDDHSAHELLDVIEQATSQIITINQNLLALGRRGSIDLVPLDLNDLLSEAADGYTGFQPTIRVKTFLAKNLPKVLAQKTAINKVLAMLLENAQEAMIKGGEIILTSALLSKNSGDDPPAELPAGDYVKLTIEDNGGGIAEENMPLLFEPLFSTKKINRKRGSGLGLSVAYSIMMDHHGLIKLTSQVGDGTIVYLYFPIAKVEDLSEVLPSDETTIVQTANS